MAVKKTEPSKSGSGFLKIGTFLLADLNLLVSEWWGWDCLPQLWAGWRPGSSWVTHCHWSGAIVPRGAHCYWWASQSPHLTLVGQCWRSLTKNSMFCAAPCLLKEWLCRVLCWCVVLQHWVMRSLCCFCISEVGSFWVYFYEFLIVTFLLPPPSEAEESGFFFIFLTAG